MIHLNYPVDDPRAQSDEQVEADVRQRARPPRPADDDPQDHALVGRRGDGVGVPGRTRLPARRRRASPSADRRSRADERDPRRPEPVLEARRRPRRPRRRRSCSTPTSRSGAPRIERNAQRSLENAVNHFAIGDAARGLAREQRRSRTGRTCAGCGAGAPEDAEHRGKRAADDADAVDGVQRAERRVRLPLRVRRGRPRRQPGARTRSTRSASTSPPRAPARRCRTPGSTTRTATGGRSRTWSRPGRFLLIAGEDGAAVVRCRPRARGRGRTSRSTPCASATSMATSTTRAACGCATARSGRDGAVLVRPDRFIGWRSLGPSEEPSADLAEALSRILARPVRMPVAAA